ncbi:nitrate- and nitrite sensing domain-containing protein [Kibdelosporangium philippinense]|uniref:sensor histidine kinase n=1 Tax=Kibdelosporangium philippinense TaxID=211113 RepID=UPI0036078A42
MPDQNAGVAGSSGFGRQAGMPGGDPSDTGARPQGPRAPGGKTARAGSPWRMRNWRLRTKVLAVVIIPTLTALALGGLRAQEDLERADEFRQTVNQVDLANNVTLVVHELQKERTLAVDNVAQNRNAARAELDSQINTVNNARQRLSDAATRVNTSDEGALERYNRGLQRLAGLDALRQAAKDTEYPHIAVKAAYTSIIEALVQLGREVNTAVTNQDLLRQATTVQGLSETKEFASQENAALQIAATVNNFPSGLLEEARAAEASFQAAQSSFRANATPQELQFYSDTVSGPEVDDRERIKSTAFNKADNNQSLGIDKASLVKDGTVTVDKLRTVEENLLTNLRNSADKLATARTNSAWFNAAIVLALLIAALILMALVTRSILKPLRVLRTNALDVAYTRLPETVQRILADPDPVAASKHAVEPMPVFTREETGEVARSFDAVHEQAVRMAAEQALLRDNVNSIFVNLSRRSQALVERQLNLIDRLEQDEQDPDQLASLFELDHLATRMRRNSESLLVLSGTGLSRQLTRPVPSADVVGAAVSEVEQYARIEVLSAPEVAVQGRAVNDLVHLIAELLDNATSFSEPEKKVTVRMAATRKKELAIQITDQGVGMSADEIESANRRLADPPDMDVSVTRRMGLYVVARLAQRHNIQVRLRDNEDIDGGLIARIIVPASLIQSSRGVQATNLTPTAVSRPSHRRPSRPPWVARRRARSAELGRSAGSVRRRQRQGRAAGSPTPSPAACQGSAPRIRTRAFPRCRRTRRPRTHRQPRTRRTATCQPRLDGQATSSPRTTRTRQPGSSRSRRSSRNRLRRCSVTRSPRRRRHAKPRTRVRRHPLRPRTRTSTRRPSVCRSTRPCCRSGSRKATATASARQRPSVAARRRRLPLRRRQRPAARPRRHLRQHTWKT